MSETVIRCPWAPADKNANMVIYHDTEWGKPQHDEQKLFELLSLETYQAGLSWQTVLNKRDAFRQAFHYFEVAKVAKMSNKDLNQLLENKAIIRNRLKLAATINNAKVIQAMANTTPFSEWLWSFVDNQPIVNDIPTFKDLPATSPLGDQVAKAMKKQGFKFVGPTTVYSYLEAAGLINDHLNNCRFK